MPSIFDIIGPVTVGPSSSHTAGAIRIGQITRLLLGGDVRRADITLYGSFAETGKGHGTDRAIVGGLLGLDMASPEIPESFQEARRRGLVYSLHAAEESRYHPNTVVVEAIGENSSVRIRASSVGGGNIRLDAMGDYELGISCDQPTLVLPHNDHPGVVAAVTTALSQQGFNIAAMKVARARRGGDAVAMIETDTEVPKETREIIAAIPGVTDVIYIPKI
jgi:L-serine dehydratase